MPRFSWDTIPVFFHSSNSTGPFTDAAIKFMAKYPMVTVEKFQGPCGNAKGASPACHQEALIINELRRIKEVNSNVSTIFYYNSVLDFPQYDLHKLMMENSSLMLHNEKGQVVKMHCPSPESPCDVFDFSQAAARQLFIDECINATKTGYVDGCFLDRAVDGTPTDPTLDPENPGDHYNLGKAKAVAYTKGHIQAIADMQTALPTSPIIANHGYGEPMDNLKPGVVSFSMIEGFDANNGSIMQLLTATKNGRGVQAHSAHGCEDVNVDIVAAFLVGAGPHAYFGCGPWSSSWMRTPIESSWLKFYDYPLGEPQGPATVSGRVYTRKFGEKVIATFDCSTNTGKIEGWGPINQTSVQML